VIQIGWDDDLCRAFAAAHDREEAAQRGEPDPWAPDSRGPSEWEAPWEADRIACVRVGLAAVEKALKERKP
jgi:hypothetical protein